MKRQVIVEELRAWIYFNNDRTYRFNEAIASSLASRVKEIEDINTLEKYFDFLNDLLVWIPSDNIQGTQIFHMVARTYFILNQPSVINYQSPIAAGSERQPLTWLSDWIVRYGKEIGMFMDTRESMNEKSLAQFKRSPKYRISEYVEPRAGWRTFNQFFARNFKPGLRPISSPRDPGIIVSPADWTFHGKFDINADSQITVKGLTWRVRELLGDSSYRDRFQNGTWMHGYLGPYDYHRVHAPVEGSIVEARVIRGQHYVQIHAVPKATSAATMSGPDRGVPPGVPTTKLRAYREFTAPNDIGYQFFQSRGLVVLESGVGLVAVIPVGMAMVSSVQLTASVGKRVRKGDELGYFQFGGSEVVVLFGGRGKIDLIAENGEHYKMGTAIASMRRSTSQ